MTTRWKLGLLLACASLLINCASSKNVSKTSPKDIQKMTEQAYIYAYPLVLMGISRDVMTATPRASQSRAPLNQISNKRSFPDANFTDVVSPNADTLYSSAWLDLSEEPMVLSIPDAGKRYYMMPLLSAWTDVFASPGSRTTGYKKGNYAITGPNWTGTLPANVVQIKSPTNSVWMIGRTKASKSDFATAHKFQDGLRITPLNEFGKNISPPDSVPFDINADTRTPPVDQIERMDAQTFFAYFANELKTNPPTSGDAKMIQEMASLGITPGNVSNLDKMTSEQKSAFNKGFISGQDKLTESAKNQSNMDISNGWGTPTTIGTYGDDYLSRAVIAKKGLGANLKQDAIYPWALTDSSGAPLNGSNKYVIRFTKGNLPPVDGFWSLTMYNSQQFFVKNPINRFAIGDRDKLRFNKDGSLDIYIQASNPGKSKESNWLPAPANEDFNMIMRLYWPKQAVLDGTWKIPGIEKVQSVQNLSENQN
ncbi:DUF1254 domain-containing protein [Bdellovibrio sp. HCB288]|uniref:DUF1254 domain-containing protein n=1 Tax=Bdellovibrio sp. HCB288 TaxID=3394355 RepID=UPI0039B3694A